MSRTSTLAAAAALLLSLNALPTQAQDSRFANTDVAFKLSAMSVDESAKPAAAATVAGEAVAVANVDGVTPGRLRLTPSVLARIFRGDISMWDSPQIARLNPGTALPHAPIAVVQQAADTDTSHAFVALLASRTGQAAADPMHWKVGAQGATDQDVAVAVRGTHNSIGYVAGQFAAAKDLPHAVLIGASRHSVGTRQADTADEDSTLILQPPADLGTRLTNPVKAEALILSGPIAP